MLIDDEVLVTLGKLRQAHLSNATQQRALEEVWREKTQETRDNRLRSEGAVQALDNLREVMTAKPPAEQPEE